VAPASLTSPSQLYHVTDVSHHSPKRPQPSKLSRFDMDGSGIAHKDFAQPPLPNGMVGTWETLHRRELLPLVATRPWDGKAVQSNGGRHFGHGVRHSTQVPTTPQSSHSAPITFSL